MSANPAVDAVIEREKLFEAFEKLMPFRVQDILLVSSLYDSFILREDGRLNEMLIGESYELNLQHVPRITNVKTGAEALALARSDDRFNLIVANLEVEDMNAAELATEVKRACLTAPSSASSSGRATHAFSFRSSSTSKTNSMWSTTPRSWAFP
jgi:CheY-like chemotaxis protein